MRKIIILVLACIVVMGLIAFRPVCQVGKDHFDSLLGEEDPSGGIKDAAQLIKLNTSGRELPPSGMTFFSKGIPGEICRKPYKKMIEDDTN